ncbi:MAG: hypothetical protein J5674_01455 [Candidatus Methanomethylophilaceae archaeon]|nr:hypothetical protein [Candidatus Methanomethylophilaceae archaeon]
MSELSPFTVRVSGALFLKHVGRVYVITDDDADFKRAVEEFRKTSQVFLLCPFTLIQVKDDSDVEDPALARAIRENGASLAGILMAPLSGEPAFLMQRRGDGDLPKEAMDFVFGLSSSTREAIEHIYDSLNQEEPKAIDRILDTVMDLPVIGGLIDALSSPGEFGMVPDGSSGGRRRRANHSEAYYKAQKEFVNNVITRENTDDIEMVIQKLPPQHQAESHSRVSHDPHGRGCPGVL